MKIINKTQDQTEFPYYLHRGNKFIFPTSKLVKDQQLISGTKRDMRKKFIKSDRPTYMKNRIINRAQEGLKFNSFEMVQGKGVNLDEIENTNQFQELNEYDSVRDLVYNLIEQNSPQEEEIQSTNFDVEAATNYLTEHAKSKSTGYCARSIRLALEHGGLNTLNHPISASMYNNYLSSLGFSKLAQSGYTGNQLPEGYKPQKGDIIVIGATKKHPHGHISMYNGTQWVSDFKQKTFHGLKDNYEQYTIWRHI